MASSPLVLVVLLHACIPTVLAGRLNASVEEHIESDLTLGKECGREVAETPNGQDLQSYFDGLRMDYGILNSSRNTGLVDTARCTKKDICLLMRQLDMDFYERARQGTLTDHDYDTPPTKSWHMKGNCETESASRTRGYRVQPVMDYGMCSRAAKSDYGIKGVKEIQSSEYPTGCVIVGNQVTGKKKAFMNTLETTAKAGVSYTTTGSMNTIQLCAMDRSLSESAAAYYSPYKLKPSMEGREAKSTSCSFGMMAYLANLQETMSPCARIITYRTDPRFHSAAHALQMAELLESKGPKYQVAGAKIRQYVETVRAKYVLLDTIANHWCPGVWTAAKGTEGATCSAPRAMAWTEEGAKLAEAEAKKTSSRSGGRKKRGGRRGRQPKAGKTWVGAGNQGVLDDLTAIFALLEEEDNQALGLKESNDPNDVSDDSMMTNGKPIKIALNEQSCFAFEDESLADRLADAPEAPPDFFRDAFVSED